MKAKIFTLMILTAAGIIVMVTLNYLSGRDVLLGGAFLRKFPPHPITAGNAIDLKVNSYYFAGHTGGHLVLANRTNPNLFLSVNPRQMDTSSGFIHYPPGDTISLSASLSAQDDWITMADAQTGRIYKAPFSSGTAHKEASLGRLAFTKWCQLDSEKFIFKRYNGTLGQNILSLYGSPTKSMVDKAGVLTKQVDGVFCTEGNMAYDRTRQKLVYTYMFRNQFIVMDSAMNVLYRASTIDTNTKAKLEVVDLPGGRRQLAAPPVVVNKLTAVSSNYLFVLSEVRADNDVKGLFTNYEVLDVYELKSGKYRLSFYLPKRTGNNISDLTCFKDSLYVMQGKFLLSYALNF